MQVNVNGDGVEVSAGATVAAVLAAALPDRPAAGVAVALNGAVVPRGAWNDTPVREADRIEVLTAVQGG